MTASVLVAIVILFAVGWRARALFVRQRLLAGPLQRRLLVSAAVGVVVVALGAASAAALLGDAAGLAAGAACGWVAARATTIERGPSGSTYLPNRTVAAVVGVIFVARFAYRLVEVLPAFATAGPASLTPTSLFTDPITSGAFLLIFAYYAVYCARLLPLARREANGSEPAASAGSGR